MILSAGLGTRLRPLTLSTPKALLVVAQSPMILYSLKLLKASGLNEVVINLYHLGELVEKELGNGSQFGMKIRYSWEKEILGTGGGIKKAAEFFRGEPLIVINSDVLIDLPLKKVIQHHQRKKGIATMVVRTRDENSEFSPLEIGRGGRILSIGTAKSEEGSGTKTMMYTGVQVIEPKLLAYLPDRGPSCIVRQGYLPALAAGEKVYSYPYEGYWNDLGTMDRYRQAENDLSTRRVKLSFLE
ncbi:MAG: nucleotidyltransferase family protein [Deltaproteobacteria bacterium]|nr:nucleotidyltransferase family protein [Deltaproteobacteria bacterium]